MNADPHAGLPVLQAGGPLERDSVVVVAVHGRGGTPEGILELTARLERPGLTCLAPTAAGQTWYPFSFMAEKETNQPGISSGLRAVGAVIARVQAAGVPPERTVLLGFSQGACLAAEYAMQQSAPYGGVIAFSGGLIGPPGTRWPYGGKLSGVPVFLGCSDVDPHVPADRIHESAAAFEANGAEVTARLYPGMGHLVNDDEIEAARGLLDHIPPP